MGRLTFEAWWAMVDAAGHANNQGGLKGEVAHRVKVIAQMAWEEGAKSEQLAARDTAAEAERLERQRQAGVTT